MSNCRWTVGISFEICELWDLWHQWPLGLCLILFILNLYLLVAAENRCGQHCERTAAFPLLFFGILRAEVPWQRRWFGSNLLRIWIVSWTVDICVGSFGTLEPFWRMHPQLHKCNLRKFIKQVNDADKRAIILSVGNDHSESCGNLSHDAVDAAPWCQGQCVTAVELMHHYRSRGMVGTPSCNSCAMCASAGQVLSFCKANPTGADPALTIRNL